MRKSLLLALAASAALCSPLFAQAKPEETARLRDAALKDNLAWEITEGLTTEIGPRYAGSESEARARDWAIDEATAASLTRSVSIASAISDSNSACACSALSASDDSSRT